MTTTAATISTEGLLQALHWRYATKLFDPSRRIPEGEWEVLEHSLRLTPSSFGLQPYRFMVVRDPALREQLKPESWGQSQITDASHLVVFLARQEMTEAYVDAFLAEVARTRGVTLDSLSGYRNRMISHLMANAKGLDIPEWSARQAYIALGQLMTSAAFLGVDACPIEGLDPQAYDRILGLEGGEYRTVAACAVGYRSSEDKYAALAKVRLPLEHLVIRR